MWTYEQATGWLISPSGKRLVQGYSGHPPSGVNNPALQMVAKMGPLPRGFYTILPPVDSPEHGPDAMPLLPDQDNEMFGRSGFMIHGDSLQHPGYASLGCIIVPRFARDRIIDTLASYNRLQVI